MGKENVEQSPGKYSHRRRSAQSRDECAPTREIIKIKRETRPDDQSIPDICIRSKEWRA